MAFEVKILPDENGVKMPIHLFTAIISEYLLGNQNGAEAKTAIENKVGALSVDETADITAVLAYIDGGTGTAGKQARMRELDSVFICAEEETWYGTQELLRIRLNWA